MSRRRGKLVKIIRDAGLEILVVNLIIIPFRPKLDKFYCNGVMN